MRGRFINYTGNKETQNEKAYNTVDIVIILFISVALKEGY